MRPVASATLLALVISFGSAWAQAPAPTTSQDQKKTISKSCSDQANAKGLHGKARKKFRSECKRSAGKPHVQRLDDVFAELDETPRAKNCDAIIGVIEEGQEVKKEYKGTLLWMPGYLRPRKRSNTTKSPATAR
jgi:hypothetical protein